ncbi:hypothetical protein AcV7_002792 [Taiwanofungus camphoratus]|nr:hypothetical protein AcV7_002792 [Antrodia cinnamomea]
MNAATSLASAVRHALPEPFLENNVLAFLVFTSSIFLLSFAVYALYHTVFSPLAAVPGPWYAAISDFWLNTHVARLQQCMAVQALFQQYGPVVRVGPNKVAFCDTKAMSDVYNVHKFDKSSYYKNFMTNGNNQAMTVLPHAQHVLHRKAYSSHYNTFNLSLFQPEMHMFTLKLVDILDRISGKTSVECLDLFRHLMVDIITVNALGFYPESLDNWSSNVENPLATAVYDFPKMGTLRGLFPTSWAWNIICQFPNDRWRQICNSDKIIAQYVGGQLSKLRSGAETDSAGIKLDNEKRSLIQRMLQSPMPDKDIISEGMGHLIAGVDTAATTLSYLSWELSRRLDIVSRLRAELDGLMPDRRMIPDVSILFKLPYLDAFIKEGERLYAGAPSLLERVVPSTAPDKLRENFQLVGYNLPPGTIVATQAWSMHRDTEVFPFPESFSPERWLPVEGVEGEDDRLLRMTQRMMPFGLGTRLCAGRNLAQIVLRIVIAAIVTNFDVAANAAETNETSMTMREAFIIFPASKECRLSFHPRK